MPRRVSFLPALTAVLATLVGAVAAPADAADTAPPPPRDRSPLGVQITSLSPSSIPHRGPIRISGVVTNRSDETWDAINLHPFVGTAPIRTSEQLEAARRLPPEEYVGERIYQAGTFDTVPTLAPGESAQYSIRLARSQVAVERPGVYWFGVHALGQSEIGRDDVADGRARTFLPLVPRSARSVNAALVIPVRHAVRRTDDGQVADVEEWAETLDTGGTLRSLVDFGASAGDRSVTWLVDPAVIDSVRSLVGGNLPRSLEDTADPAPPGEKDSTPTEPTEGDSEDGSPSAEPEVEVEPNAATEPGAAWLNRFAEAIEGNQVLGLPYGDVDVSAAIKRDPPFYERARRRSERALETWDLPPSPAVSSPSGYVDPTAFDDLARNTTVLVTDRMFSGEAPGSARVAGRRVHVTSWSTSSGGPGPGERRGMVPLRQQILSEAALRLLNPGRKPLVVVLPDQAPDLSPGFFTGLDVDWLNLTRLDSVTTRSGPAVDPGDLEYPDRQVVRELDSVNFAAAEALIGLGRTLDEVLTNNDAVAETVRDEALTGLSYSSRDYPASARVEIDRSSRWISGQLTSIRVNAPRSVTLSSSRGGFSAIITNGLDHAVVVRLESVADAPLRISDSEPVEIPAGGRAVVPLQAATDRLGVYNVELLVTTEDGVPLGSRDVLPIRSSQVSDVIWLIIGTGVALLFGAIVVRLVRRIRRARA